MMSSSEVGVQGEKVYLAFMDDAGREVARQRLTADQARQIASLLVQSADQIDLT